MASDEKKVLLSFKLFADSKTSKNLLESSLQTVLCLNPVSNTLGEAVLNCIQSKSTVKHISDISMISSVALDGTSDITETLPLTIQDLQSLGIQFGITQHIVVKIKNEALNHDTNPKPKIDTFARMMKSTVTKRFIEPEVTNLQLGLNTNYINESSTSTNEEEIQGLDVLHGLDMQFQVKTLVYHFLQVMGIGYHDKSQKDSLMKFVELLCNTLCTIELHWSSLFRVQFPQIQQKNSKIIMLTLLTYTNRK